MFFKQHLNVTADVAHGMKRRPRIPPSSTRSSISLYFRPRSTVLTTASLKEVRSHLKGPRKATLAKRPVVKVMEALG
jgi:hypothetical protein